MVKAMNDYTLFSLHQISTSKINRLPFPHLIIDSFLHPSLLDEVRTSFGSVVLEALSAGHLQPSGRSRLNFGLKEEKLLDAQESLMNLLATQLDLKKLASATLEKLSSYGSEPLQYSDMCIRSFRHECHAVLENKKVVSYDFRPGINPAAFSGLQPHIDRPHEILAGLLYIDLDPSRNSYMNGGALLLHEATDDTFFNRTTVDPWHATKPIKRIPFKHNQLAIFLNGSQSIHSVEPYLAPSSGYHRSLINLTIDSCTSDYLAYDLIRLKTRTQNRLFILINSLLSVCSLTFRFLFKPSSFIRIIRRSSLTSFMSRWNGIGFQRFTEVRLLIVPIYRIARRLF